MSLRYPLRERNIPKYKNNNVGIPNNKTIYWIKLNACDWDVVKWKLHRLQSIFFLSNTLAALELPWCIITNRIVPKVQPHQPGTTKLELLNVYVWHSIYRLNQMLKVSDRKQIQLEFRSVLYQFDYFLTQFYSTLWWISGINPSWPWPPSCPLCCDWSTSTWIPWPSSPRSTTSSKEKYVLYHIHLHPQPPQRLRRYTLSSLWERIRG